MLADQLQSAQAELEEVRSHFQSQALVLPDAADLLQQLRVKMPKAKVGLREVEAMLDLIR